MDSTYLLGTWGGIYQALFRVNPYGKSGLLPQLGTSYKIAPDGMSATVSLRKDAKWADGQKFTADDVVYTYDTIKSVPALNLRNFDGEIAKLNDYEVKITTPKPEFQNILLWLFNLYIVPQHIWKDYPQTLEGLSAPADGQGIGTGPMTALKSAGASFTPMAYTLGANKYFYGWKSNPDHVDGARFIVYTSNQAQMNDLYAGKLDWADVVDTSFTAHAKGKAIAQLSVPSSQVSLITCANKAVGCSGPATDPAVRQAIFYAMDRGQLNKLAANNTWYKINSSLYPLTMWQSDFDKSVPASPAPMSANAAKAASLLTADGYAKDGSGIYAKGGQELELSALVVSSDTVEMPMMTAIQQQLGTFGIKLNVVQTDSTTIATDYKSMTNAGKPIDMILYGLWITNGVDAYGNYNGFFGKPAAGFAPVGKSQTNNNFSRIDDPDIQAALATLNTTNDPAKKKTAFTELQKAAAKAMPYIPVLTQATPQQFWTDQIAGWPTAKNLYANPSPWKSPDVGIVLATISKK